MGHSSFPASKMRPYSEGLSRKKVALTRWKRIPHGS